jgi:hypothetical protein
MSALDPSAFIVAGRALPVPAGLDVRNFADPKVFKFEGRSRAGQPVTELVIHESVTRSASSTVAVLKRRELGVHLVLAPDGRITQHGDLAHARLAHAGGHNGPSVGVEVVNPYYPYLLRDDLPWSRTIPAPWAHGGAYVLPTPAQAEATAQLVAWLTSPAAEGLSIPRAWLGLSGGRLRMGAVNGADQRRPGVYAHHYFAHADGAWLALYAWLRLEAGLEPNLAYEEATRRATNARGSIDVSDLIASATNTRGTT